MGIDITEAFEDVGGVPTSKKAAIDHLNQIPISAAMKRRYLRAWSDHTHVRVEPEDYGKLTDHRAQR